MYRIEQKNEAVKNVQSMLLDIAYAKDEVLTLPIDGVFDSQTKDAVIRFQYEHNLPPTGIVDNSTFDTLCCAYHEIKREQQKENQKTPFPLCVTSQGVYVEILQNLLNRMAEYLGSSVYPFHSGYFSDRTESAVKEAQKILGEKQDGKVTKSFMRKLQYFLNLMESD